MSALTFFQQFIRNWQTVGAVAPSSPALAARMAQSAEIEKARHILELGPGTGALTEAIRQAMPKEADYLGIEINATFADKLRQRFQGMNFAVAGAQEFDFTSYLKGMPPIDVIISGLPWSSFPHSLQDAILGNVLPHLTPGGRFATFAYYGFHRLPRGRRFRALLHEHLPGAERSSVVWGNLPPAFVYVARK